jgi:hypothetical protein
MLRRVNAILLCAALTACGGDNGTKPTSATSYQGQWTGTTAQGAPIAFTISGDEKVTSITLGYDFNGCSGSQTFSNLAVATIPDVTCIPGPCPSSISTYRQFGYSSGDREGPVTSVNGLFPTQATAEGVASFRNYPSCGTAIGVPWSATRR